VAARPGPEKSDDQLAEWHLARRMIVWTLIMVPIGILILGTVVTVAVAGAGGSIGPAMAVGAGIGTLAGIVAGPWAGFLASNNEFEELERAHRRPHRSEP
jgi:H+/Cl- antiporter ClcA